MTSSARGSITMDLDSSPISSPPATQYFSSTPATNTDPEQQGQHIQPTKPPLNTHCPICNSRASAQCPTCHQIAYCSASCAILDHPTHKTLCTKPSSSSQPNLNTNPNPTTHRLAFFFPQSSRTPQLIPLRITQAADSSDDIHHRDLATLWNVPTMKHTKIASIRLGQNVHKLRTLDGEIAVLFTDTDDDEEDSDGDTVMNEDEDVRIERPKELPENEAVARLLVGRYAMPPEWRGPVLVVGIKARSTAAASASGGGSDDDANADSLARGLDDEPYKLRDMSVADLTDVVDILGTHGPTDKRQDEKLCVDIRSLEPGTRVQTQFMRCTREVRRRNNARASTLWLSSTQLAAMESVQPGETLAFTRIIGLPLKLYTLASAVKQARPRKHLCHDRDHICDMLKAVGVVRWHGMNPSRMNLGFHNKDCPGEALFVREDGGPLTEMQWTAIWSLAKEVGEGLMDAFETCDTKQEELKIGNAALVLASEASYREWFRRLKEKELAKGNMEWKDAKPC